MRTFAFGILLRGEPRAMSGAKRSEVIARIKPMHRPFRVCSFVVKDLEAEEKQKRGARKWGGSGNSSGTITESGSGSGSGSGCGSGCGSGGGSAKKHEDQKKISAETNSAEHYVGTHAKHTTSIYDGHMLSGVIMHTYCRGHLVFSKGVFLEKAEGEVYKPSNFP